MTTTVSMPTGRKEYPASSPLEIPQLDKLIDMKCKLNGASAKPARRPRVLAGPWRPRIRSFAPGLDRSGVEYSLPTRTPRPSGIDTPLLFLDIDM